LALATLFILLPGMVAFGIANRLSGYSSQEVNKVLIELALHSSVIFFAYSVASAIPQLHLVTPAELVQLWLAAKTSSDGETLKAFIDKADWSLIATFIIAVFSGVITALERERNIIRWLGSPFGLFQHNAVETAWHDTFKAAGPEAWVQVDVADGRRFVGLSESVSWDYKDGGICLQRVYCWDESKDAMESVADWIYLRSEDIAGPIIFTKPEKS